MVNPVSPGQEVQAGEERKEAAAYLAGVLPAAGSERKMVQGDEEIPAYQDHLRRFILFPPRVFPVRDIKGPRIPKAQGKVRRVPRNAEGEEIVPLPEQGGVEGKQHAPPAVVFPGSRPPGDAAARRPA